MKILRNNVGLKGLKGLQVFAATHTNADGGATHSFILETHAVAVVSSVAYAGTTIIAGTVANSTAYPGTKKITWTVPISGVLKYIVICSDGYDDTSSTSADVTRDDAEVY